MKRFMIRVVPLAIVVLVVGQLFAQQPGRGGMGGGLGALLTNKGVQEELKLSGDQTEKLTSAMKEVREKYGKDIAAAFKDKNQEKVQQLTKEMSGEVNKLVEKTLKPEQVKRLHQIEIQAGVQRGNLEVLLQERVQKALSLTDKQKESIKESSEALTKERREAFGGGQFDREKMQAIQKKAQESAEKILGAFSADQKKAWKELTGDKFEVKFEPRRKQQ